MGGTWALIENGIVTNVIIWDGAPSVDFGDGVEAVEYTDESPASIGYIYSDGKFTAPPPSAEDVAQQNAEKISNNLAMKDSLMADAKSQIVVSQTKLLMGRTLTDAEKASLNAWMDYIDALDAVDANTDTDVVWPVIPS